MDTSKSVKAYDPILIKATKSMPEAEVDQLLDVFLLALKGLDDGTLTEVDKVDSFYRVGVTNRFGTQHLPYYERHIVLYLILTFSSMISVPEQWDTILKVHKEIYITEGECGVLFHSMKEFHTMMMLSKMESEKIIQFPGGDNDRTNN